MPLQKDSILAQLDVTESSWLSKDAADILKSFKKPQRPNPDQAGYGALPHHPYTLSSAKTPTYPTSTHSLKGMCVRIGPPWYF